MITRRQIRIKAMQSIYAMQQGKRSEIAKEKKFLRYSMEQMQHLYWANLAFLIALREYAESILEKNKSKHLASTSDKNPNAKFVNNRILQLLEKDEQLTQILHKNKINYWESDSKYVSLILDQVIASKIYQNYMRTTEQTIAEDRDFIIQIFKEIIAPNDKLYDYFEDKRLTWIDDMPLVNTYIVKTLQKVKTKQAKLELPKLFRHQDDEAFAKDLFEKTILHIETLHQAIAGKTPNWDTDRLAELDKTMILMGICEFLYFPSIPVKVTINEYLEIAKDYSSPKSGFFVNGILDKISKEYQSQGILSKSGRGLL